MGLKELLSKVTTWKSSGDTKIGATDEFIITQFEDRIEVKNIQDDVTTIYDPIFSEDYKGQKLC